MKHITLIIIAMLFSVSAFAQQTFDTEFTQTKLLKISGKTTEKASPRNLINHPTNQTGANAHDGQETVTQGFLAEEVFPFNMVLYTFLAVLPVFDTFEVVGLPTFDMRNVSTFCHHFIS